MKKILIIALAMILILLTCSCDNVKKDNDQADQVQNESGNDQSSDVKSENEQSDETQNEVNNDQSDEAKTENDQTDELQNENSENMNFEDGGFGLSTYEEYLEYIERPDLPEGFLFYDDVKQFGNFFSLSAPMGIRPNGVEAMSYVYNLEYKGKRYHLVLINELINEFGDPTKDICYRDDIQVDLSDMRYPVSGVTGVYYHNNVRYRYMFGYLIDATWYEDGWTYLMSFTSDYSYNYPDNDGSALAKLIYLE